MPQTVSPGGPGSPSPSVDHVPGSNVPGTNLPGSPVEQQSVEEQEGEEDDEHVMADYENYDDEEEDEEFDETINDLENMLNEKKENLAAEDESNQSVKDANNPIVPTLDSESPPPLDDADASTSTVDEASNEAASTPPVDAAPEADKDDNLFAADGAAPPTLAEETAVPIPENHTPSHSLEATLPTEELPSSELPHQVETDHTAHEHNHEHDHAVHEHDHAAHEHAVHEHDHAAHNHAHAAHEHDHVAHEHDHAAHKHDPAVHEHDHAAHEHDHAAHEHDHAAHDHDHEDNVLHGHASHGEDHAGNDIPKEIPIDHETEENEHHADAHHQKAHEHDDVTHDGNSIHIVPEQLTNSNVDENIDALKEPEETKHDDAILHKEHSHSHAYLHHKHDDLNHEHGYSHDDLHSLQMDHHEHDHGDHSYANADTDKESNESNVPDTSIDLEPSNTNPSSHEQVSENAEDVPQTEQASADDNVEALEAVTEEVETKPEEPESGGFFSSWFGGSGDKPEEANEDAKAVTEESAGHDHAVHEHPVQVDEAIEGGRAEDSPLDTGFIPDYSGEIRFHEPADMQGRQTGGLCRGSMLLSVLYLGAVLQKPRIVLECYTIFHRFLSRLCAFSLNICHAQKGTVIEQ